MPPKLVELVRRGRLALVVPAALMLAGLSSSGAHAVVGGADSSGPLAAATAMVLNSRGGVCSGLVLAPDVVLTAAHCVSGGDAVRVHFRAADGAPVLIEPSGRTLHPGYDGGAVAGRRRSIDLALLRLPEGLPERFVPARLAAARPGKGQAVVIGGYGVDREGDARSTGTFRTADLTHVEPYGPSTILLWAAGAAGTGACEGDSGGPIAGSDGAILAVTSWAAGAGRRGCGSMSQGVLLGPQRAWLDRTLASWGRAADWR